MAPALQQVPRLSRTTGSCAGGMAAIIWRGAGLSPACSGKFKVGGRQVWGVDVHTKSDFSSWARNQGHGTAQLAAVQRGRCLMHQTEPQVPQVHCGSKRNVDAVLRRWNPRCAAPRRPDATACATRSLNSSSLANCANSRPAPCSRADGARRSAGPGPAGPRPGP